MVALCLFESYLSYITPQLSPTSTTCEKYFPLGKVSMGYENCWTQTMAFTHFFVSMNYSRYATICTNSKQDFASFVLELWFFRGNWLRFGIMWMRLH